MPIVFSNLALRKTCPYSEFFWSVFSRIRNEYGEIRSMSPWENTDQKNFEYGYFSRSVDQSNMQSPLNLFLLSRTMEP